MSLCKVEPARYKDISAVKVQTEKLEMLVLPEQGGKIASLKSRESGQEFLVQASGAQYSPLAYGGSYVDAECSGIDDMFPTIDPIACSTIAASDIILPDHGEACRLPWQIETTEPFSLRVQGVCLPYTLQKQFTADKAGGIRIDYRLQSQFQHDLHFIWAAHTMLQAEEGGQIRLPVQENTDAVLMFSSGGLLGERGQSINWPVTKTAAEGEKSLNLTAPYRKNGESYKYYFPAALSEGWCRYVYPSRQTELVMRFPVSAVPYLGVWVNEGGFRDYYNVAFEPATAPYDRPDIALANGNSSILPAMGVYQWYLTFACS